MRRVIPRTSVFAVAPMRFQHAATAAETNESGIPRAAKRSGSSSPSAAKKKTYSTSALGSTFHSWSTSARMAAVGAAVFVGYFGIKKLYAATVPTQAAFPASTRAVRDNRDGNNTTAALNSMTPQTSAPFKPESPNREAASSNTKSSGRDNRNVDKNREVNNTAAALNTMTPQPATTTYGVYTPEGPTRAEAAVANTKNTNPRDGSRDSGSNKTVGASQAATYDKADASTTAIKNNSTGFFGKNKDPVSGKPTDYQPAVEGGADLRDKVGYFNQSFNTSLEHPVTMADSDAANKPSTRTTFAQKENERPQRGYGLDTVSVLPTTVTTPGRTDTKANANEHEKADEAKKNMNQVVMPANKEKASSRTHAAKDERTSSGRMADKPDDSPLTTK